MGKKAGVKTTSGGRDKPCCFEQGEEKIGLGMIVTTLVIVILVRGFGLPDETSLDSSSSSGQRAPAHSLPTVNVRTNGNTKEYDRKFLTPSTPKSRPPLDPGFLDAPAELYAAASNAASLHPGSKYTVYLTAKFGVEEKFKSEMEKHVEASKRFPNLNSTYAYYKFPQAALDDSRFVQHRAFLGDPKDVSAKGGGYWFWKPLLTLHLLENLPDDTFVLYTDAGTCAEQNSSASLPKSATVCDGRMASYRESERARERERERERGGVRSTNTRVRAERKREILLDTFTFLLT